MTHYSEVEHPKRPKLSFNSMFQIVKLVIQSGWCHSQLLELKDANFYIQQTQKPKTLQVLNFNVSFEPPYQCASCCLLLIVTPPLGIMNIYTCCNLLLIVSPLGHHECLCLLQFATHSKSPFGHHGRLCLLQFTTHNNPPLGIINTSDKT